MRKSLLSLVLLLSLVIPQIATADKSNNKQIVETSVSENAGNKALIATGIGLAGVIAFFSSDAFLKAAPLERAKLIKKIKRLDSVKYAKQTHEIQKSSSALTQLKKDKAKFKKLRFASGAVAFAALTHAAVFGFLHTQGSKGSSVYATKTIEDVNLKKVEKHQKKHESSDKYLKLVSGEVK